MELQDTMDIVDIEDTMLLPKYQLLMAGWGIGWNSGVTSCHSQPRGTDVGAAGDMVAHCCYLVGQLTRGMVTSTHITISTIATATTTEDRASTTPAVNLIMGLLKAT